MEANVVASIPEESEQTDPHSWYLQQGIHHEYHQVKVLG
jgi:hypothetical protein